MSDVALLMGKDPNNHTREDITAIVQFYRSQRHMFNSGIKVGAKPAAAVTKAAEKTKGLGDLRGLTL